MKKKTQTKIRRPCEKFSVSLVNSVRLGEMISRNFSLDSVGARLRAQIEPIYFESCWNWNGQRSRQNKWLISECDSLDATKKTRRRKKRIYRETKHFQWKQSASSFGLLSVFICLHSLFLSDTQHTERERETAASINENILLHHTKDVINCCLISIQGMHPKHSLVAIKWYKYMFYNCTLIICREERQQQTDDNQCRRAVCARIHHFSDEKSLGPGCVCLSRSLAPQLSSFIDLYPLF